MYQRASNSSHVIEWTPDHEEEAEKAMLEVVGEIGIEVDRETANEIREKYQNLTEDKD